MLPRLIEDAKHALQERVKFIGVSVVVEVIVVLLAVVALFFFTLAGFVWAEAEYGALAASVGFGVLFAALAVALFIAARIRARRFAETGTGAAPARYLAANPAQSTDGGPEWLIAPVGIATGIEVLRKIGARRLIPAFALAAVVISALQTSRGRDAETESKE